MPLSVASLSGEKRHRVAGHFRFGLGGPGDVPETTNIMGTQISGYTWSFNISSIPSAANLAAMRTLQFCFAPLVYTDIASTGFAGWMWLVIDSLQAYNFRSENVVSGLGGGGVTDFIKPINCILPIQAHANSTFTFIFGDASGGSGDLYINLFDFEIPPLYMAATD
jgi:hypothetical protein